MPFDFLIVLRVKTGSNTSGVDVVVRAGTPRKENDRFGGSNAKKDRTKVDRAVARLLEHPRSVSCRNISEQTLSIGSFV